MEVRLNRVRVSFPHLFEPHVVEDGKPRFSLMAVIEPGSENEQKILAAIEVEADAKFGKKAKANLEQWKHNNMKYCYQPSKRDETAGMMVLSANSPASTPPTVFGRRASDGPVKEAHLNPIYAGCYANILVDIYAQAGAKTSFHGIRCGLRGVQFVADGEAFAGGRPATPGDFEDLNDGADAENADLDMSDMV